MIVSPQGGSGRDRRLNMPRNNIDQSERERERDRETWTYDGNDVGHSLTSLFEVL